MSDDRSDRSEPSERPAPPPEPGEERPEDERREEAERPEASVEAETESETVAETEAKDDGPVGEEEEAPEEESDPADRVEAMAVTVRDRIRESDEAHVPLETMTLVEHLREMRTRLLWSVGAVLVGMLGGLTISRQVMAGLTEMCTACGDFQTIAPLEGFVTYFRVALILGLVVATPVILYQIVRFVLPALHGHEKRYLLYLLPGASLLFVLGLLFGYFIVLPRTINFLAGFLDLGGDLTGVEGDPIAESQWRLSLYIAFVTNLLLILGLAFQTPLVVYLLAKLGVVTTDFLRKHRKHAALLLAVLAAVLTPTPDPFTMIMVLLPMYLLYELGIILARIA